MNKINIVFSPSSLNTFLVCPAKYNMSKNLRKTIQIIHKAKPLDIGALCHIGFESYYSGLRNGMHYNDRVNNALMKVRAVASDVDESNLDITEELSPLLSTLEQNFDFWRAEDEMLEILGTEIPFDFILYEDEYIRIVISGKIDLLVNDKGMSGRAAYDKLPIDHKTFKRDFIVPRKDNQFISYAVATESNYLLVNRVGQQKSLKADEKFKRLPMSYDPLYLEGWKKNTISIITNHYLTCVRENIWPENSTSCFKFNRPCEFYEVCDSSGDEAKAYKLENNYIEVEPFDKYRIEGIDE